MKHNSRNKDNGGRAVGARIADIVLRVGAFFVILEPIWMLLPFAGFLYGSVMHIELLSSNPRTSWLVHFVFPVHTLFPVGIILILAGLLVFVTGAVQIYSAKLFGKGLVRGGLYKKFRHPQYLALTLFGIGILLTWGRFITFISFFLMLWLYYFLSKGEERKCLRLFGRQYEEYLKESYFIFPGERVIQCLIPRPRAMNLPGWVTIAVSFVVIMGVSVAGGILIQGIKSALRNTIPVREGRLALSGETAKAVRFMMIKGPAFQGMPSWEKRDRFMEKVFEALTSSEKIRQAVSRFELGDGHTVLAFLTPGSNWYHGGHGDYRMARMNAFILIAATPVRYEGDNFREFRRNWQILKLIRAAEMNYGRMEAGQDPVEGEVVTSGPPWGAAARPFQERMEERIDFFLSGLWQGLR